MIRDPQKAIEEFRNLVDAHVRDEQCVKAVTRVFDHRMRALDETSDISLDESEQISTNCDRFLFEVGQYLESKGEAAKRIASAVADHIASFIVECERPYGNGQLVEVARVLGACFCGSSLTELKARCDAVRRREK
jgi:hypothetical protein